MKTRYIDLTGDWLPAGRGPALLETEGVAHIHLGAERPTAETRAFHQLGSGHARVMAIGQDVKIWARAPSWGRRGLVITGEEAAA